jgi:hypothetical protein
MPASKGQRALWMVLLTTLVGPLVASLIAGVLAIAGPVVGGLIPHFSDLPVGAAAVQTFVWAAVPSLVAGAGLSPYVMQAGTYGWLHAAVAGVIGFASGVFIAPFADGGMLPVLAFVAGLVMIGLRGLFIRISILLP